MRLTVITPSFDNLMTFDILEPSPTRNFLLDVKELANKNCSGRLKIKSIPRFLCLALI